MARDPLVLLEKILDMEASDSPKSIAKAARNKILALPYMAKLSSGKTFAFGMQFTEKLSQLPNAKSFTLHETYRNNLFNKNLWENIRD